MRFAYRQRHLTEAQVMGIVDDLVQREINRLNKHPDRVNIRPTHKEIAEAHGTSTRTVKRIRRRMRETGYWDYCLALERQRDDGMMHEFIVEQGSQGNAA